MQEINAKIVKQKIISSNISISQDLTKRFELNMECRAKMKTPKNEEDKSVLLNIELIIETKDEELKIEFASDFIFELDQLPDDYNELAEQKLVPMARESILNSLDDILVIMGYNKMELAKKMR
jgi:hypothetical protein